MTIVNSNDNASEFLPKPREHSWSEVVNNAIDSNLSVKNAIDCLEEVIHLAPPDHVYCSNEKSGGEEGPSINNLSRKQLLANCELHLQSNEMDEETNVISNAEELANLNT